jgi:hypothetical protein
MFIVETLHHPQEPEQLRLDETESPEHWRVMNGKPAATSSLAFIEHCFGTRITNKRSRHS